MNGLFRLTGRLGRVLPAAGLLACLSLPGGMAAAMDYVDPPYLEEAIDGGSLQPVAQRLPDEPYIVRFDHPDQVAGEHGGTIRMLMQRSKDMRQMTVYGYSRLVRYTPALDLEADILAKIDVEQGRIFTLHLRRGHKWSDGHPFTTEDFRYWWEDMANNDELYPVGPPAFMRIGGHFPEVTFIDDVTIRYEWPVPNPDFLPGLAQASPNYIYAPAHYLKQFHIKYGNAEEIEKMVEEAGQRSWASLHTKNGRLYRNENPALPTLQPWVVQTESPSDRFVFTRNPYFHRVDANGLQLPYVDEVVINISERKLIPGKASTGDVDLQGRYLQFDEYTLLKRNEKQHGYSTRLWRIAKGAHLALYPNLTHSDPMWRELFREPDFRRALSLAINRYEINRVIYFGLAIEGQNTVLPGSPLYEEELRKQWTDFDIDRANALLDGLGLKRSTLTGLRVLPNGEPLEIIVETAGSSTEETDVLQLITDTWRDIGVRLFTKPLSIENMRRRVFAGESQMVISSGIENGLATPDASPVEFAPVQQIQYHWSNFGQYYETNGNAGEPIDMPEAQVLRNLLTEWYNATEKDERRQIWDEILQIHSDNVFVIGLIAGVYQPIVVKDGLRNIPEEGMWNWDPGAHFGIYGLDRVWWDKKSVAAR